MLSLDATDMAARFHYMFDYLEVPVAHMRIMDRSEAENRVGGNIRIASKPRL